MTVMHIDIYKLEQDKQTEEGLSFTFFPQIISINIVYTYQSKPVPLQWRLILPPLPSQVTFGISGHNSGCS